MKFYVAFFFVVQFLFLGVDASSLQRYENFASFDELKKSEVGFHNGTIAAEQVDQVNFGGDELLIDESKVGTQKGNNVALTGFSDHINLTLKALTFRFCTGVTGIIQICYDSFISPPTSVLKGSCAPSECELKIEIKETNVNFKVVNAEINVGGICDTLRIESTESEFNRIKGIQTCPPKIVNAEIKYPEILTTPLPSTPKPTASDSNSTGSLEWWGIVIIIILALIIFGIVATFGFLCWKKRQASKPTPAEKPTTVITDAKEQPPPTIQTASKTTRPDLNFTQFEPSKSQKKQKKPVTKEPTTTEEFIPTPPPKVTVSSPPDLTKPFPKQPQYSIPQRVIPRSYKSLKTDSLEEIIEKNKLTPVESVIASVSRNVLKSKDSEVFKEMKKNYPEVRRVPMQAEIVLFCVKISLMFTELHEMTVEAEQSLVNLGVQFDAEHRIVSMSPEGREYLQNPKTPSTTVYFAFGAEYHEYIFDDMVLMPKLSVAHQLVIALQPRFAEFNRRK
uniref:Uncharacterized protein n=1 Tax=Panagrolaimus sp. ES5 TaxID=591445 RepID=A0AC34G119_9BILA